MSGTEDMSMSIRNRLNQIYGMEESSMHVWITKSNFRDISLKSDNNLKVTVSMTHGLQLVSTGVFMPGLQLLCPRSDSALLFTVTAG